MNDYSKGALEALFYANHLADKGLTVEQIRAEVNSAITDLYNGIAVDFRDRLRERRF